MVNPRIFTPATSRSAAVLVSAGILLGMSGCANNRLPVLEQDPESVSIAGQTGSQPVPIYTDLQPPAQGQPAQQAPGAAGQLPPVQATAPTDLVTPASAATVPSPEELMASAQQATNVPAAPITGRAATPADMAARVEAAPMTASPAETQTLPPELLALSTETPTVPETTTAPARVRATGAPQTLASPLNEGSVDEARAAFSAAAPSSAGPTIFAADSPTAAQVIGLLNEFRAANGLRPVTYSESLSQIAGRHVDYLKGTDTVTSLNAAGQGIGNRLLNEGLRPGTSASVVAGGYPTFGAAFQSWTSKEIEASRLLIPTATEVGFAGIDDRLSPFGTYFEMIIIGQ